MSGPIPGRRLLTAAALVFVHAWAAVCLAPAAFAEPVDLELVIAVDVSTSMDAEERLLQQQGFASAFRDAAVAAAIRSGPTGRIAVTYLEWGGDREQRVVVPWALIDGTASGAAFAGRLDERRPGLIGGGTSIGNALAKATALFAASPFSGTRQVINLSGDGISNRGLDLAAVRDTALAAGITINGLAIVYKGVPAGVAGDGESLSPEALVAYFAEHLIGGPGAFVEPVRGLGDYAGAITRKLRREIEDPRFVAGR